MTPQKPHTREMLAAQIKRARRRSGFKKQADLAEAIGLSASVIGKVERGMKVESKTLHLIEHELGFAHGTFDAYLAGEVNELPEPSSSDTPAEFGIPLRKSVVELTRDETVAVAVLIDEVHGRDAADRWLVDATEKQIRHRKARDA